MFVSQQSQPPTQSLVELIQLCGGTVSKTVRQAGICIGRYSGRRPEGSRVVSEQWVLGEIPLNCSLVQHAAKCFSVIRDYISFKKFGLSTKVKTFKLLIKCYIKSKGGFAVLLGFSLQFSKLILIRF